ncbi:hypothetical protein TRICI_005311 [Trichomonascus ciferrii]|uniref:Mechanosensitive ion channel protein n=1 Tax=Trichomonascus ciferrii TaxID=44093 RepID=A0A642UU61_9ASCO|nr:hypothetical protein TRICI_005311 [Trichomonascus ciferrii]
MSSNDTRGGEGSIPLESMDSSTRAYQQQQYDQNAYGNSRNYGYDQNLSPVSPSELENQNQRSQQNDGSRTKSLRSFLSGRSFRSGGRRSHESNNNNDANSPPQSEHQEEKNGSYQEESRLLPTVDEEEEEEELPDLSEVVEDFEHGPEAEKRRGHAGLARGQKKKKSENKIIKRLRSLYTDFMSKTLLTRSFVYWLPLALILFIPLAVGAWGNHEASLGKTRIMWIFIWLEVVWGSLWVCRFVAHIAPHVYEFLVGIISPSWRKYSTIFKAMEKALTLVLWALVSMITFMPIMTQNPHASPTDAGTQNWQKVIQNILVALLISSLVYFAERLLIHFISVSFHKTRFAKRIKNNKLAVRVLSQMLAASYLVFPKFCEEFEQEDLQLESGPLLNKGKSIPIGFAQKIADQKNVQKAVGALNKVVGGAANMIGNVSRDITGNNTGNNSSYNIVVESLGNKGLTEVLARRIWMSLVLEDADELKAADLVDVLGEQYRADAETVFEVLDADGNGNLTLEEMVSSTKEIARERKAIYKSLRDVDSAIGKLHSVLLFFVLIIMIIIFIGMLAPSVSAVLATLGTSILGLSFIFSPTAQEILGSCVFLFVKHPLDVGDMVEIVIPHSAAPTQCIVVEVSLLYTVFRVNATGLLIQHSNAMLNTFWIGNVSRAGPQSTSFTLTLGLPETSYEDLEKFRHALDEFLEAYPRDYFTNPYVQAIDYPDLDRISLCINVTFKSNQEDAILYGVRRNRLISFLAQCVNEIPLHVPRRTENYTDPTVPMVISRVEQDQIPWGKKDPEDTDPFAPFIKHNPARRNPMGFRKAVEYNPEEEVDEKKEWSQIPGHDQQQAQVISPDTPLDSAKNEKLKVDTGVTSAVDINRFNSIASGASSRVSRHRTVTGRRQRRSPTEAQAPPDAIETRLGEPLTKKKTNESSDSGQEQLHRGTGSG